MKTLAARLLLALTAVGVLSAQNETGQAGPAARGPGPAPRNLQVLPKDMPPQEVVALMQ